MFDIPPQQLLAAALGSALVSGASIGLKFLTFDGAIAAFLLGFFAFGFGGILGAALLLGFFISSSLLSKAGKSRKKSSNETYAKSSRRDSVQVLANGSVGTLFLVCTSLHIRYLTPRTAAVYAIAAFAAANSDTWATEVGGWFRGKPILISTFKPVDSGRSGAISLLGTAAALGGSLFIVLIGLISWPQKSITLLWRPDAAELLAICWAGFMSTFVDSLLGATVQAQYKCRSCNRIVESQSHCGKECVLESGWKFANNDLVNFVSILSSVLLTYVLISYFGSPK